MEEDKEKISKRDKKEKRDRQKKDELKIDREIEIKTRTICPQERINRQKRPTNRLQKLQ